MKVTSANGLTGFIIRVDDTHMFRVYHEDKTFTDYDMIHYDLEVTIVDPDAYLYEFNGRAYLDHAPTTLGVQDVNTL